MDRSVTPTASELLDAAEALRAADQPLEAIEKLERALRTEGPLEDSLIAEIRLRLADCHTEANDHAAAQAALAPLLADAPDEVWRARAQIRIARAKCYLGDLEASADQSREALHALARTPLHSETAMALQWLGNSLQESGHVAAAHEAVRDAVALARLSGDRFRLASSLGSLARVLVQGSQYREAKALYEECAAVAEELGHRKEVARVHLNYAVCLIYLGEWIEADRAIHRADQLYRELDDLRGQALCMLTFCRLARRRRQDASSYLAKASEYAEKSDYRRARLLVIEERADLAREAGDMVQAEQEYERLLQLSNPEAPGGDISYEVRARLALVRLATGRFPEAESLASEALEEARRALDRREEAFCLTVVARIHQQAGQVDPATRAVDDAVQLLEGLGARYELAQACEVANAILPRAHFRARANELYRDLGLAVTKVADSSFADNRFLAASPASRKLLADVPRLAALRVPILVTGETGAGKTLLARLIHDAGATPASRFAILNCSTWSEKRVVSRRARDVVEFFDDAIGGTVVLKSVDRAPSALQELLVGALERITTTAEGSVAGEERIATRVLSTTNADLQKLVEQGRFLKDLYYRLTGFVVVVPPLRERTGDIRELARLFTGRSLSDDVLAALGNHTWPGNVRELENALRAACISAGSAPVEREHLPLSVTTSRVEAQTLPDRIEQLERREIRSVLHRLRNNKRGAARALGISRKGLIDRLKRLGMWEEFGKERERK